MSDRRARYLNAERHDDEDFPGIRLDFRRAGDGTSASVVIAKDDAERLQAALRHLLGYPGEEPRPTPAPPVAPGLRVVYIPAAADATLLIRGEAPATREERTP